MRRILGVLDLLLIIPLSLLLFGLALMRTKE
jgi:hypothetical protein